MAWAAVAGAAIGVGGSLLAGDKGASAATDAANIQAQSAADATAESRRQYDLARSDNAPFRTTGVAANSRLAKLLGLSTGGVGTPEYQASSDRIYNQLLESANAQHQATYGVPLEASGNTAGVESAKKQFRAQADAQAQQEYSAQHNDSADPEFGSLTRKFSTADLAADPVYNSGLKFGLDQGTNAINARAIANGGYDSGATLKALTQFGNDYGSTKANESFNRYNATNDSTYNKLAGVSGSGQVATAQTTAAGENMSNNISSNITGAGNARAAGIVGGANAWGSAAGGVNNAVNSYQSNQTLQALLKRNQASNFTPYASQYDLSNPQYG